MKNLVPAAILCLLAWAPAHAADDFSRIPGSVRAQIKAKCVAEYPDSFTTQHGCILGESRSYLEVHGGEAPAAAPEPDLTGDPSAFDRAQINNAAYLTVARKACKIDVGTMPDQYRERAIASDRLNAADVKRFIVAGVDEQSKKAKRNRKAFCAEAKKNLPNFADDLTR